MSTETNLASELLTLLREREDDVDRYEDALLLIAERLDSIASRIDSSIAHTDDVREELNGRISDQSRMHALLMQRVSRLEHKTFAEAKDGGIHLSEAERNVLGMDDSLSSPNGPERRALAIIENWNNWAQSAPTGKFLDITEGNLDKLVEQVTGENLDNKQIYDAMERAEMLTNGKLYVTTHQFGGRGRKRRLLLSNGEPLILTEDALANAIAQLKTEE